MASVFINVILEMRAISFSYIPDYIHISSSNRSRRAVMERGKVVGGEVGGEKAYYINLITNIRRCLL